jgi:hypothetical protein
MSEKMESATSMTFAQRVWYTLSRVDVEKRLSSKGRHSYLPWADAWEMLMQLYPESEYSFDEPVFFENGTGEQWVTVTIKENGMQFSRRWWLPFLDHQNRPLVNPSSLQINNTRMRALVKCIAMLGLGVYVYSGEDVPEKDHDSKPTGKRTGAIAAVMEDINLDEDQQAEVDEWIASLRDAMPSADNMDHVALVKLCESVRKVDNDLKVAIAYKLTSWQRSAMKKITAELNERDRLAAVEAIQHGPE